MSINPDKKRQRLWNSEEKKDALDLLNKYKLQQESMYFQPQHAGAPNYMDQLNSLFLTDDGKNLKFQIPIDETSEVSELHNIWSNLDSKVNKYGTANKSDIQQINKILEQYRRLERQANEEDFEDEVKYLLHERKSAERVILDYPSKLESLEQKYLYNVKVFTEFKQEHRDVLLRCGINIQ